MHGKKQKNDLVVQERLTVAQIRLVGLKISDLVIESTGKEARRKNIEKKAQGSFYRGSQ